MESRSERRGKGGSGAGGRDDRLAQALRANLQRRKEQARRRKAGGESDAADDAAQQTGTDLGAPGSPDART